MEAIRSEVGTTAQRSTQEWEREDLVTFGWAYGAAAVHDESGLRNLSASTQTTAGYGWCEAQRDCLETERNGREDVLALKDKNIVGQRLTERIAIRT